MIFRLFHLLVRPELEEKLASSYPGHMMPELLKLGAGFAADRFRHVGPDGVPLVPTRYTTVLHCVDEPSPEVMQATAAGRRGLEHEAWYASQVLPDQEKWKSRLVTGEVTGANPHAPTRSAF